MSGEDSPLDRLQRTSDEPPDEWAARLREHMQARWDAGQRVAVTEYTAALPDLAQYPEVLLDLISLHRLLRIETGESVKTEEYVADFPTIADDIREQFELEECVPDFDPDQTRSHHTDAPPLPDRFQFVRWLATGGYGRVCHCLDAKHDNRPVAVKLLRETLNRTTDRERFRREARLIATHSHPNLCTLYEFDFDHDPPFLVLELLDGSSLRDQLTSEGRFPIQEAVRIARDLAAALAHCHKKGVVHRDIKPENVQVTADGFVKLLDLGLARPLAPVGGTWKSEEGMPFGTMPYFSPEHFEGRAKEAADQFSLGVVLYEMLTGTRPFHADTATGLLINVTTQPAVSPREHRPHIDDRLAAIVLRMLAKKPDERFASLSEVKAALDHFLTGTKSSRRRWMAGGAVAVVMAAVGVTVWQPFTPTSSSGGPNKKPEPVAPQPQDLASVLQRIATDLAHTPDVDQEFQRYFRLGHREPAERETVRDALAGLLPKLSTKGNVVALTDVDGDGSLLRVDLRLLGWRPDNQWEAVVRRCPLSLRYAGLDLPAAGGTIKKLLNSDLTPFVLGDWFVAAASAEPLLSELVSEETGRQSVRENERVQRYREEYERTPVDLRRAAAELGLSSSDPLRAVLLADEKRAKELGLVPWLGGRSVSRAVWNRADVDVCPAGELSTALKLGIRRLLR